MKHLLLYKMLIVLLVTLLTNQTLLSQNIWNGDLTLSTQAEVDAFYYTEITGVLRISGSDITDLSPLISLYTIGQGLIISNNDALSSLSGLENLTSIPAYWGAFLRIENNDALTSLSGLRNLRCVGDIRDGILYIKGNDALTSLTGLENLVSVSNQVSISDNISLTSLAGLENLRHVLHLSISDNASLTSLAGLGDLVIGGYAPYGSFPGWVSITGNTSLTALSGLENFIFQMPSEPGLLSSFEPTVSISGNTFLTNFCALYPLLATGGLPVTYNVFDNAINPTQQEVIGAGLCNTPPTAKCQDILIQADENCQAMVTAEEINNGSTDYDGDELSLGIFPEGPFNPGNTSVTLTVEDGLGGTATCDAFVTVEDNIAPIALCQDVTVQLDASGNGSTTAEAVSSSSSDACGIASLVLCQTDFDCNEVGVNDVTLTVTDKNGNLSTCNAEVTVEDNVAPVALCKTANVELDASGNGSITAEDINDGSSDACGIKSLSVAPNVFNCDNIGENLVTLTVIDNSGNESSETKVVTVQDNISPEITCPEDVTLECSFGQDLSPVITGMATGSDNCGNITVSFTDEESVGCGSTKVITRVWTATDENGNQTSCEQIIKIVDTTSPLLTAPSDVTVDWYESTDPASTGTATSTDLCGSVTVTFADEFTGDCGTPGTLTRTWIAIDECGNSTSQFQTVTILEPDPIELVLSEDKVVYPAYSDSACTTISLEDVWGGTGVYNLMWSTGETTESIEVCPSETTEYSITVTDENGCVATGSVFVSPVDILCSKNSKGKTKLELCYKGKTKCMEINTVDELLMDGASLGACSSGGDNEVLDALQMFLLYPNPFSTNLTVSFTSYINTEATIAVYTAGGVKVYSQPLKIHKNFNKVDLNLTSLISGTYLLTISGTEIVPVSQIVIKQ